MIKRTEHLIILKLQSGDEEALVDLYKEYEEPIFRFIYFRVSDRELAKDITQDVFAKFLEVANKERITNLKAYLYRIAKNLVIDNYRKQGKQQMVSLDQTAEVKTILGKESMEAKIDLEIAIKAVDQLKPMWREIIILRLVEGFEYEDIADVLGKSENYIRVNLHRALNAVNEIIK